MRMAYTTSVYRVARLSLVRQGYGVPRDGPNHSGAAEPTSSGHLTGGFA